MRVERPAVACGGVRGAGAARGRPPPLDVLDLNSGIGAGDRVWTTRAGTLAGGARSRSTSTNFSSAATGSGASLLRLLVRRVLLLRRRGRPGELLLVVEIFRFIVERLGRG